MEPTVTKKQQYEEEIVPYLNEVVAAAKRIGIPYIAVFDLDNDEEAYQIAVNQNLSGYDLNAISSTLQGVIMAVMLPDADLKAIIRVVTAADGD
jgi:hypothetical protein